MAQPVGSIIGTRELSREGSRGKPVTVTLGKPRKRADGDWECAFRIAGLRVRAVQYGYGVDAIQALTTALEGIRVTLERSGQRLAWIGGEAGDAGFERLVPTSFGPAFTSRLNRLIDREINRVVQRLERQHLRRSRRAASRTQGSRR